MERTVLLITADPGAQSVAAVLSEGVNAVVEVAPSRRAALAMLRRRDYSAVVLDTGMPAAEVTTPETLWRNLGPAIPLEIALHEFRAAATMRLLRHVLQQCDRAKEMTQEQATSAVEEKLRSAITGLLLQSDLLLRESAAAPKFNEQVRQMRELTQDLRTTYIRDDPQSEGVRALHSAILHPRQSVRSVMHGDRAGTRVMESPCQKQ